MTNKYVISILISVSIAHAEMDTRVCDAILDQAVIEAANGSTQQAYLDLSRLVGPRENEGYCQGMALSNMAGIRQRQGRLDEAERHASRSVSILERDPENRSLLVYPLIILALVSVARKQFRKASKLIAEIESIPRTDAREDALLLGMEAQILVAEHHLDDAETKYKSAMVQWEKAGKGATPDVVPELNNLAKLYVNERRFAEARVLLVRALPIAEGDPDPSVLIQVLNSFGVIYARQDEWHEAERYFRRAIELQDARPDTDWSFLRDAYKNYEYVLRHTGRKREAKALELRANALFGDDGRSMSVDVDELMLQSKRRK